ncbi:conserved protein of unknown function [Rhodovastum atsumiense]|uniref:Uncharacterized protein n=1 Tax=Rhodovastum atsumiense TaxID=504468 RepID=A0A5M6IS10_9PROT|nr:hypothetical protein [Rhodovastum atsumiense]KAA5610699.1 hypothetical protein F1189_18175 [Rhodovastum atsumiense]CAH2603299.1 conserved protein of unknown function [Rhodovastum atsumiense]
MSVAHGQARQVAMALLGVGLTGMWASPARADEVCQGSYMASVMQQRSLARTVALAEAPENPGLAAQFINGFREGGASIDSGSNFRLSLVFTLASAGSGQVFNNFTWADQQGGFTDVQASTLRVTAQVLDTTDYAYVWVISADCQIQVRDANRVAHSLGLLVGRTLGRSVPNGTM